VSDKPQGVGEGVTPRASRSGTSRGSQSSRGIIYIFPEPGIAGVLVALSSPISFAKLGFTSELLAFVAGLQLVGRLQKGTEVGRVLPVGDAGVGEAAVR
jgi:hypothetical protein